jgi:hypothetical protein
MMFDPRALSSYLTFRWLVTPDLEWTDGLRPDYPSGSHESRLGVGGVEQIMEGLASLLPTRGAEVGLLLSGGMDSAILAALLPRGTPCYTIEFSADGALSEGDRAARFAQECGLRHRIVRVGWTDHLAYATDLMQNKRAPLHPVEVGLFMAARAAQADGVERLIVGNGADSNFGGLDRLLSRDWTLDEFERRYTFLPPSQVLRDPRTSRAVYERYLSGDAIDLARFLREVHGPGITQAFSNALSLAQVSMVEPYERLRLTVPLDLGRIRAGESKYLLRSVFRKLFPTLDVPEKVAFVRPMNIWLASWTGPSRPEFRRDIDLGALSGEQRWLLWSLERFLDWAEGDT